MDHFILYSYWRSSCSYRVRIGLHYKGLAFNYETVNLIKSGGTQFEKNFRQINPLSQVPVLKHGQKILNQSLAILLYLEEFQKEPALLPKDSFQKAEILSFCEMINSGIQPLQNLSVLKYLENEICSDKNQWTKYWIEKGLKSCEEFLKSRAKSFCFGSHLSLADLFLIPQVYNAKRFQLDLKNLPCIERINENCLNIPAFQKALPENQPDAQK